MVNPFPDNKPFRPIGDNPKRPIEKPIEKPIQRPIEKPIEKPIQRPIEKPIQRPIEKPIQKPIEKPINKPIEKPIQKPIGKPSPERTKEARLREIMEYQFIVYDIALYLDTHPNDPRAHEARKKYTTRLQELIKAYEEQYGPINLMSPHGDYTKYVKDPWPWEIRF